eukprot:568259-Pleurochrysis_carterae.AAC.1
MMYKWGHPVATLPSDEGDYTSLKVGHKFCKSLSSSSLAAIILSRSILLAAGEHDRPEQPLYLLPSRRSTCGYLRFVGSCSDDRSGTSRLLGDNLAVINKSIADERAGVMSEFNVEGAQVRITTKTYIVLDVSALRHSEHLSNSGWCGCSRDRALRTQVLCSCHSPTATERFILSHMPLLGETLPRPCTTPGCMYGHVPSKAADELAASLQTEATLKADTSNTCKRRFSRWRMGHAATRQRPACHPFQPMLHSDLKLHILDSLHLAKLGLPKTAWKFGIMNNASDDARAAISEQLAEWKHPLDCRR